MQEQKLPETRSSPTNNLHFLAYMRLFGEIDKSERLFPKQCAACKKVFDSLSDYISSTYSRRHTMEDCSSVMHRPFTMVYRQCGCGNTLVLNITDEAASFLDSFWEMLTLEARKLRKPLTEVVADFVRQWELYLLDRDDS